MEYELYENNKKVYTGLTMGDCAKWILDHSPFSGYHALNVERFEVKQVESEDKNGDLQRR